MKVIATRNFSNGIIASKSVTKGPRNKRKTEKKIFMTGKVYDIPNEDEIAEALHFGWLKRATHQDEEEIKKTEKDHTAKVVTK